MGCVRVWNVCGDEVHGGIRMMCMSDDIGEVLPLGAEGHTRVRIEESSIVLPCSDKSCRSASREG